MQQGAAPEPPQQQFMQQLDKPFERLEPQPGLPGQLQQDAVPTQQAQQTLAEQEAQPALQVQQEQEVQQQAQQEQQQEQQGTEQRQERLEQEQQGDQQQQGQEQGEARMSGAGRPRRAKAGNWMRRLCDDYADTSAEGMAAAEQVDQDSFLHEH